MAGSEVAITVESVLSMDSATARMTGRRGTDVFLWFALGLSAEGTRWQRLGGKVRVPAVPRRGESRATCQSGV